MRKNAIGCDILSGFCIVALIPFALLLVITIGIPVAICAPLILIAWLVSRNRNNIPKVRPAPVKMSIDEYVRSKRGKQFMVTFQGRKVPITALLVSILPAIGMSIFLLLAVMFVIPPTLTFIVILLCIAGVFRKNKRR